MPRNTTFSVFFYTYVLESLKDFDRYIGYTDNLKRRIEEHQKGLSFATKFRLPFKLIYFEGCLNQEDAKRREDYLKTIQSRRFLGPVEERSSLLDCPVDSFAVLRGLRLLEYKRHQSAFGSGS